MGDAVAGTLIDHLTALDGCGLERRGAPGAFPVTGGGEAVRVQPGTGARRTLPVGGSAATPWRSRSALPATRIRSRWSIITVTLEK